MNILDYEYNSLFQDLHFGDKNLTFDEIQRTVNLIDETIAVFSVGLPQIYSELERIKGICREPINYYRSILSVFQFNLITMIDSMVACKYYLLASKDYEKRFMRGKLKVILNEGFKRLYGFTQKAKTDSVWAQLKPLMLNASIGIRRQYQMITNNLERLSQSSSWWKRERDLETHLNANELYRSRQEEIVDSRVMEDSLKLFDALLCVNKFLEEMNRVTIISGVYANSEDIQ